MNQYLQGQIADRARYLRDTRNHRMSIKQDDGMYHHITMRNPKSWAYGLNVTTFPGYLVFTGDMGSYTFSRTADMFEFHRINWSGKAPTIDYRYWASKADALDRHSGDEEFDENAFKRAAIRAFWNHDWPDPETRREEWETEIREIIGGGHHNSDEATRAMMHYTYGRLENCSWGTHHKIDTPFTDFYEYGPFTKPCFRLKWACWAIAETIRAYDLGGDRFARQQAHDQLVLEGRT